MAVAGLCCWRVALPDQYPVLEHLADAVQRHHVCSAFYVDDAAGEMVLGLKPHVLQRYVQDAVLDAVVVAEHELAAPELGVPAYAAQELLDGNHATGNAAMGHRKAGITARAG